MTEITYPTAFQSWGYEEKCAMARVIESGRFTMGPECEAFEHEFAAYHGMKHGIMVNSGSSANLVAVAAHVARGGDCGLAIVPSIAWATTYAPLRQYGFTFEVVDVDETWNADYPPDGKFIPDVVIGCSVLGNPAHLAQYAALAEQIEAVLIEDNCESLGARTADGRLCGTFGLMNTFSFFWSHQLSAIEGGMILTNDDECARLCRLIRNHGNAGFEKKNPDFDESYDFQLFGYNVRPLELHAAIGREQLKKLDRFIANRLINQHTFWMLTSDLANEGKITLPRVNGQTSPFGLHFCVESNDVRRRLVAALRAAGVDCRLPTGGSFTRHGYGAPWRSQATPNADRIHSTGLFLGNAPWDISHLIERAVKIMKETL